MDLAARGTPVAVGGFAGLAAYGPRSPYPPTLATRGSLLDGAWEPRLQTALAWAWQATFVTYKRNFPFFLSHNNTANFAKLSLSKVARTHPVAAQKVRSY